MSPAVRHEVSGGVARLTIDRPPLNILDLDTLAALDSALATLSDDSSARLLVVSGAGDRAFSAGVAVEDHTPDRIESMLDLFHRCLRRLTELPVPSVAAVRGHCLGGGMELAAACDLRFGSDDSRYGQPEIELGCYPPWAAAHYPALLGVGTTIDLLLTGRIVDGEEAARMGFLHRLVEAARLEEEVEKFAAAVTRQSAAVARLAMRSIRARRESEFGAALAESERLYVDELTGTRDMIEGLEAFLQKRTPEWQHR